VWKTRVADGCDTHGGPRLRTQQGENTMVKRRKFLIGVGTLAAGSGAGLGTGAFSSMSASRDANINVVNDASGLIALNDTTPGDTIGVNSNGELSIDFSGNGSNGVNVDSRYQVGTFSATNKSFARPDGYLEGTTSNTVPNPAFTIQNNDDVDHTLDIEYELDANDISGARVFWQFELKARQYTLDLTGSNTWDALSSGGGSAIPKPNTGDTFSPGSTVDAVLFVDTRDYTGHPSDLDLSGTLTINGG